MSGTTVYPAGTSRNHMHWVLQDPTNHYPLFYSLIDIGCRMAHGLDGSSDLAIADAIFGEFATRSVVRASDVLEGNTPTPMKYYGDWLTGNIDVGPLLAYLDGQCSAWRMFFIRCLHAVGIDPFNEVLNVWYNQNPNPYGAGATMLINTWNFGSQSNKHRTKPVYPYMNIWGAWTATPWSSNSYDWVFADVTDSSGVPGQATSNPLSYFDVHLIVNVGNKYYDPSSGVVYTSFGGFEAAAIEAYALDFRTFNFPFTVVESDVGIDLDGDGSIMGNSVAVPAVVIRPNPTGNNLDNTITDTVR